MMETFFLQEKSVRSFLVGERYRRALWGGEKEREAPSCLGKGTHVGGFEPPIPDRLKPELHRFLVPQTPEPLGVNVALVHEHVELNEDEFWYLPVCPFFAIFWLFG